MKPFATILLFAFAISGCSNQTFDSKNDDVAVAPVDRTAMVGERPVRIGFDGPRFDACAAYATVINIGPGEDARLSVRNAPADSAEEVDALAAGSGVAMCQETGGWIGIVYPQEEGELGSCGTGSPVPSVRDYDGPCRSGWVRDDYLKLIAG